MPRFHDESYNLLVTSDLFSLISGCILRVKVDGHQSLITSGMSRFCRHHTYQDLHEVHQMVSVVLIPLHSPLGIPFGGGGSLGHWEHWLFLICSWDWFLSFSRTGSDFGITFLCI